VYNILGKYFLGDIVIVMKHPNYSNIISYNIDKNQHIELDQFPMVLYYIDELGPSIYLHCHLDNLGDNYEQNMIELQQIGLSLCLLSTPHTDIIEGISIIPTKYVGYHLLVISINLPLNDRKIKRTINLYQFALFTPKKVVNNLNRIIELEAEILKFTREKFSSFVEIDNKFDTYKREILQLLIEF